MSAQQPHIVYVLSDEHYGGAMGHMGDPNVATPNMDAMAAQGAAFGRARANCPICTPSRGTIFSGRHAHAGPVQFFFDVFKPLAPSTATELRKAGYHTAYFGKWHCGVVKNQRPPAVLANPARFPGGWPERTPEMLRGGFQDWNAFEVNNAPFDGFYYHQREIDPRKMDGYQTDCLTSLAIRYLEDYRGGRPLFLVLSVEPPHFPLEVPAEFLRWDPARLVVPPDFEDTPERRRALATYYGMIENLDRNIGRLRETLARLPAFRDRTFTAYFSDHGDFMGTDRLMCRKELPQEESVRIPALFEGPGIPPQGVRPEKFSLVDMMATTLGLAGCPIPSHSQGRDFSPALRGEPFEDVEAVLLEMQGSPRWTLDHPDWRGLVTDRYKYAFYETGHEQLFDLETDRHEMVNLAAARPDLCRTMRELLLRLLRATREPYFDVLIEHGAPPADTSDVGSWSNGQASPAWNGLIQRPDSLPVNKPV